VSTETVVNYVVEYRLVHSPERWLTWDPWDPCPSEEGARALFKSLLASKRARGTGRVHYRVVKRTAVITDDVILEEEPEEPSDHERSAP